MQTQTFSQALGSLVPPPRMAPPGPTLPPTFSQILGFGGQAPQQPPPPTRPPTFSQVISGLGQPPYHGGNLPPGQSFMPPWMQFFPQYGNWMQQRGQPSFQSGGAMPPSNIMDLINMMQRYGQGQQPFLSSFAPQQFWGRGY